MLLTGTATARDAIPIDSFARLPNIQSVSMSTDGKNLVAIVSMPDSKNQETGLATWNLDDLKAGSVITPSGDRMKFIAANAMKANRVLVLGRQEWTGQLGGCGEGGNVGATKTFVVKPYLTDVKQQKFEEAFADKTRRLGVSEEHIHVIKPLHKYHDENVEIIRRELAYEGVSVIIPRRECIQTLNRKMRQKAKLKVLETK